MGPGADSAAVVATIMYVISLTKAKFTDKANVGITLKKSNKTTLLKTKGRSALRYLGDPPGRHELIGTV